MRLTALFKSANFKLSAAYVLLFSVSVAILAIVVYLRTGAEFQRQAQLRMQNEAHALQTEFKRGGLKRLIETIEERERDWVVGGLDYNVYTDQRTQIFGTLKQLPRKAGWARVMGPPDGDEEPGELEQLFVLVVPLSPGLWLSVGDDFGKFNQFGNAIVETFGWAIGLTVLLAIAGGVALSAGFLRRIEDITTTAQAIIGGEMHRRIPVAKTGDEMDRLAITLNRMLDRIASLMEALKQVSNDIAHELRTPLSRLRQSLEDAREKSTSAAEYDAAIGSAIDEANDVLATFSALLRIAQIEAGTRKSRFADVNLSDMANDIVQTYSAIIEDAGKDFTFSVDPNVHVNGDGELLLQLAVNLIENAIRHTPPQSRITMTLRGAPDIALCITDNGPGIAAEHRQSVFERFHRLEHSQASPGSGLGLSIVAAIADLHGLVVTLDDNHPGLRVTVQFSAEPREPGDFKAKRGARIATASRLQAANA